MVISVCSHKGGTGKTTSSLSLAVAMAQKGKKVLLVDLDPQANLSYSIDLSDLKYDVSHLFTGEASFDEVIKQCYGIAVLPSSRRLADIEFSLQAAEDRVYFLKQIIEEQKTAYDLVILDCPPSRSLLTVNALVCSDFAITPVLLDVLSIQGLLFMTHTIRDIRKSYNTKLKFLGLLAVNVDMRKKISREVLTVFKEEMDYPIFNTMVRTNTKLAEAPSHGLPIQYYQSKCTASIDYRELANEIWEKITNYGVGKKAQVGQAHSAY
jgi:chromosome partitioning protein